MQLYQFIMINTKWKLIKKSSNLVNSIFKQQEQQQQDNKYSLIFL